jgi:MFS family permease
MIKVDGLQPYEQVSRAVDQEGHKTMKMIRQFRALSRPVQLLLLNLVVISTGFYMLMPYLSSYLGNTLGFTAWMVGLVLGMRTFSQQGLYVIGGTFSDHVGYKPVIAGGCALRMAGFLLFGYASSLSTVLVAALLSGLGGSLFSPAARAYLASESGDQKVEAFALFQVSEGLGACLGPLLGMALIQVSFQWISVVASTIFFILTVLQLLYLPRRDQLGTTAPRPVLDEWREVLANRVFVVFAVGMVAYLTLYNQLYLSLPLAVQRLTGNDGATGILFTMGALLNILAQVHITAYFKTHWRPLQAITLGLVLMAAAFFPLLVAGPLLPLEATQTATTDAGQTFFIKAINLSPAVLSVALLSLGAMILQPFVLSLIPVLAGNRLLGTYFGFYYMAQGVGVIVGNLAIGVAFDLGQSWGVTSVPWLLLLGLGLASALSIMALDGRERIAQVALLSAQKA